VVPHAVQQAAEKLFETAILSEAKNLALCTFRRSQSEILRGVYPERQSEILRFAPPKVTSSPRKRESSSLWTDVDPRLRGGDDDFHMFEWTQGSTYTQNDSEGLRMTTVERFSTACQALTELVQVLRRSEIGVTAPGICMPPLGPAEENYGLPADI